MPARQSSLAKLCLAAAVVLVGTSCASDDGSSGGSGDGTRVTEVSAEADASVVPSTASTVTSATPATTTIPATTTTSMAPTTTALQRYVGDGFTISRDTALAANACFDAWWRITSSLRYSSFVAYAELTELGDLCAAASDQLEVDHVGTPHGNLPSRQLAVLLALISVEESLASLSFMFQCPVTVGPGQLDDDLAQCRLDLEEIGKDPSEFLVLDQDRVPPAFVGPVTRRTVADIDELRVG